MSAGDTALLVVDVQEKLLGAIADHRRVAWNIRRLIDGAKILGLPVAATEQYPRGLGPTVPELAERLASDQRRVRRGSPDPAETADRQGCRARRRPSVTPVARSGDRPQRGGDRPQRGCRIASKLSFSCGACPEIFADWQGRGIHKVLVCGIEAHVCVQQTVLDLLAAGWRVYLAVDAVGSRFDIDRETALRRMDSAGATLTTTEAALFEWCEVAGTPQFKKISRLAKEPAP